MDIKAIKERAKTAFRANYWRCVLVAFLLTVLASYMSVRTASETQEASGAQATAELTEALNSLGQTQQLQIALAVLTGLTIASVISLLLRIFVFNPLQVGGYRFFRKNEREQGVKVSAIGEGFGGYGRTFVTLLLRDLLLILWTLLLIIPGIVKGYSYMLVPYILKDNPELSATEAIRRSKEMMDGHKMDAFLMDLSFIGWFLLGWLTLNLVNYFWTLPYYESAKAEFYLTVKGE